MELPIKTAPRVRQEKYQLFKNGIRLRGAEYLVTFVNDTADFIHGFFASVSNDAFSSEFNEQASSVLSVKYFNELHKISNEADSAAGVVGEVAPIYYFDYAKEQFQPTYQVLVASKNRRYVENIFVSAVDGELLGTESLLCEVNFPGTAQSQYSGAINIVTDASTAAGPFRLQETRGPNNVLIRTRNMNNRTDYSLITDFTDNDNNWQVLEHGADRAAFDAHWGAEMVFDYWRTVHGRNSINDNGMAIESNVHFGSNLFNAFWDKTTNTILYGDGFGGVNPLTSLDICAHEFGHGIDQFTGDLLYENESGALDEGFADIWAACVEAWAKPAANRWLIGEEVWGGPLRSMINPNAFGQPDTYLSPINWVNQVGCTPSPGNDWCGVHTNSGVLNFWFFLLSEGGAGTNDIGNGYNVAGLGIETAAEIAYATKLLTSSSTNFVTCRSLSIQAATTLFGANSCEVKAVIDAWFAVGVGAAYNGTLGMSISGPNNFCITSSSYTISGLPTGATVTWSANPSGAVTLDCNPCNSQTLTKNYDATVNLTATIINTCGVGGTPVTISKNMIAAGFPPFIGPTGADTAWPNSNYYYYAHLPLGYPPVSDYYWEVPSGWTILSGQGTNTLYVRTGTAGGAVEVDVTACGITRPVYKYVEIGSGSWWPDGGGGDVYMRQSTRLSPNPADNFVTISMGNHNSIKTGKEANTFFSAVTIYDITGAVKKRLRYPAGTRQTRLNTSDLGTGTYIVEITDGRQVERQQLVIQR